MPLLDPDARLAEEAPHYSSRVQAAQLVMADGQCSTKQHTVSHRDLSVFPESLTVGGFGGAALGSSGGPNRGMPWQSPGQQAECQPPTPIGKTGPSTCDFDI